MTKTRRTAKTGTARPLTAYEQFVLDGATYFTAARGMNPTTRFFQTCATLEEAVGLGLGDGRTMIYAVNSVGNSAHIRNA